MKERERDKSRQQLSAYLDGELSESQAREMADAIASDSELAAELESLRAVSHLVSSFPRESAPPDMVSSILQQAERSSLVEGPSASSRPSALRWVRRFAIAAVLAISVCIGVAIMIQLWTAGGPETARVAGDSARDEMREPLAAMSKNERGDCQAGGQVDADSDGEMRITGVELASAVNVDIYTADPEGTQRSVEKVLINNRIEPVVRLDDGSVDRSRVRRGKAMARGASYHANELSPTQVQYVVYVDEDQVAEIQKQLKPVIERQAVSQAPAMPLHDSGGWGMVKVTSRNGLRRDKDAESTRESVRWSKSVAPAKPGDEHAMGLRMNKTAPRPGEQADSPANIAIAVDKLKPTDGMVGEDRSDVRQRRPRSSGVSESGGRQAEGDIASGTEPARTRRANKDAASKPDSGRVTSAPSSLVDIREDRNTNMAYERLLSRIAEPEKDLKSTGGSTTAPGAKPSSPKLDAAGQAQPEKDPSEVKKGSSLLARLFRDLLGVSNKKAKAKMRSEQADRIEQVTSRPANRQLEWTQVLDGSIVQTQQAAPPGSRLGAVAGGLAPQRSVSGRLNNVWAQQSQIAGDKLAGANVRQLLITVNYRVADKAEATQTSQSMPTSAAASQPVD